MSRDPYAAMAAAYDRWFGAPPQAMLAFLHHLAGLGPCLEIGVGTGRVALPLAASGVPVVGVDASRAMLAECERRRDGQPVRLVQADAAADDFDLGERFPLVYCVFSAFFDVPPTARGRMLAALARHTRPGGHVVLETFVPRLELFSGSAKAGLVHHDTEEVVIDLTELDLAGERFDNLRVAVTPGGCRTHASVRHYLWPAHLDTLALGAGLRLRQRTAGWADEPFAGSVGTQVAVYTPAGTPAGEEPPGTQGGRGR